MDDKIFDKIHEVDLKERMETFYIDYAMSVIASRALPDVRDGLKPVQRRILYAMIELNNGPDKPHRKCARIVGDAMGKYHPHGDSSIYGALVNMAQDWSTRYPLVDGHGNFGSMDGDGAAAMRYTEARLSKISMEMMADINKDTVDFQPNFDETEKEPVVLPSRYPNLLVNGTTGIAVGMATNIPPHNLRETIDGVIKIIDNRVEENRETTIEELMEIIKGPDFPTGAMILGKNGINQAYRTGRGKLKVRAVTDIETMPNGRHRIVATELPYMVNKAKLIEKIAELVKDKRIEGISDLRDESSREGLRVVIELKKDANPNVVLNQLYKHTQLQDTYGVIMLALVNNQPMILNLKQMLELYLKHQEEVVTRRTRFELNKAEERAHILQGLLIALDHIDEVISKEIKLIRDKYGDDRKTSLGVDDDEITVEDLIKRENTVIAMTQLGYIKRMTMDNFRSQNRGGRGIKGMTKLDEDCITELMMANTHDYILFFTNKGRVFRLKGYEIPEASRIARGTALINLLQLEPGEKVTATIPLEKYENDKYLFMATKNGMVKKTSIMEYINVRKTGLLAISLREDDELIEVKVTDKSDLIYLVSQKGMSICFKQDNVRATGRTSMGVIGMDLDADDLIVGMQVSSQGEAVLIVSEKGLGKRTMLEEFNVQNRGGKGLKCYKITDKTGLVVGVKCVNAEDELMIITTGGIIIRMPVEGISILKRITSGVKLIQLDEGSVVASIAKIREDMKDDEETSGEQAEGAEEIADVSENDSVDNSEENEKE